MVKATMADRSSPGLTEDEMAICLLYAWNNVDPASGVLAAYTWPDGFPEGSREGWRRVMRAAHEIVSASSNGRTPHFDCGNKGSSPLAEFRATLEDIASGLSVYDPYTIANEVLANFPEPKSQE